jgi:small subunit ribosomal protein S20
MTLVVDNTPQCTNNTRLFESSTRKKAVANIKSARKRARQAEKTRQHNMGMRSLMRTKIKNVVKACDAGDKDAAATAYKDAVPVIDSMINKGIVTKNKAARHKSRLNKRVRALAV